MLQLDGRIRARKASYDDFAAYLDQLRSDDIQRAVDVIKKSFEKPANAIPVAVAPAAAPVKQASVIQVMVSGGRGVTEVELDHPPAGFKNPNGSSHHIFILPDRKQIDIGSKHHLMARIKQSLMTVTQSRVTRGLEDGDLDLDRLTDIGGGTNLSGLFVKTTNGRALATACQIYLDSSGSMDEKSGTRERKRYLVERLCAALGWVLQTLRIQFQIISFDSCAILLKDFTRPFHQSFFWKYSQASGGTQLAPVMQLGLPLLAARREPRKLAIILTDEDVGTCGGQIATIPVRRQFPRIETLGFGVGTAQFPDGSFDYQLTDLRDDLVERVASTVAQVIIKRA